MDWADSRKRRNRGYAFWLRFGALFFTATSTVVVGISAIPRWVALVTVLSGGGGVPQLAADVDPDGGNPVPLQPAA